MTKIFSSIRALAISLFILSVATLLPVVVAGQGLAGNDASAGELGLFIRGIVDFINSILIPAILALAFLVFVWGVFLYFVKGGADDEAQGKGKQLMLYAIGGFVLILIFFGVVTLLTSSIGLDDGGLDTLPTGVTL